MAKTGFVWVKPPDELQRNIDAYADKAQAAVMAIAQYIAQQAQDEMRRNAPWTDRSGVARSGLFSLPHEAAADMVSIYLSHKAAHTVDYGIWLELANGGKYAIIMPTLEAVAPDVMRLLERTFSD